MILFVDLSSNNAHVDFAQLKAHGIAGVYLKATEGLHYVDPPFAERRRAARRAELAVGAYHFARPDLGHAPEAEAEHFCAVVGTVLPNELRPCLDYEVGRPGHDATSDWARRWNHTARDRFGRFPLFYSYPWFIEQLHATLPIGDGLWLASYGVNDGHEHPVSVPKPWRHVTAHQFTSRARVAGVSGPCDLSSAAGLRALS